MKFGFTRVSRNRKVGPLPVVTASKDTCPDTCPLIGAGCYAEGGPLALVWKKVSLSLEQLCGHIRKLPRTQMWRYGQAGDLPEDPKAMEKLIIANASRPVICYTHRRDLEMVRGATARGFHVNVSADSLEEADEFAKQGVSVVVTLPSRYGRSKDESLTDYKIRTKSFPRRTASGVKVAVCPATYHEVTCADCGVCSTTRRNGTIVGFPAHGNRRSMLDKKLRRTAN
jgi:hypothetical protein